MRLDPKSHLIDDQARALYRAICRFETWDWFPLVSVATPVIVCVPGVSALKSNENENGGAAVPVCGAPSRVQLTERTATSSEALAVTTTTTLAIDIVGATTSLTVTPTVAVAVAPSSSVTVSVTT